MIESRVRRTYIRDRRSLEQARAFDALGQLLESLKSGTGRNAHTRQRQHAVSTVFGVDDGSTAA